jgi:hypothetical protein
MPVYCLFAIENAIYMLDLFVCAHFKGKCKLGIKYIEDEAKI